MLSLELIEKIKSMKENTPDSGGGAKPAEGVRQRKGSFGRDSTNTASEVIKEKDYTDEQVTAVRRYMSLVEDISHYL